MLNVKITLYIKDNYYYKKYFEFLNEEDPIKEIKLVFEASKHFNLLYDRNHIFKRKIIQKVYIIKMLNLN